MNNKSKNAMITLEALVALMILFFAIMTSTAGTKLYTSTQIQKQNYEELYIATTSVVDKIKDEICSKNMLMEGIYNVFSYRATCSLEKESQNYQKAFDLGDPEGLIGNYQLRLYRVNLAIEKNNFFKRVSYFLMTHERLF